MNDLLNGAQASSEQTFSLPSDSNELELIPQQFLFTGLNSPDPIVTDDINQDGLIDVIVGDGSNIVALVNTTVSGTPIPSFAPVQNIDFGGELLPETRNRGLFLETGDIDGDGKLDIASLGGDEFARLPLSLLNTTVPGNVNLQFDRSIANDGFFDRRSVSGFATGDFNSDGKLDIAIPSRDRTIASRLVVGINNTPPDGSPSWNFEVIGGPEVNEVLIEDLNGDGLEDLIDYNLFPNNFIQISVNQTPVGASEVSFASNLTIPTEERVQELLTVDVTGDGLKDLAAVSESRDKLYIWQNNTTRGALEVNLSAPTIVPLPESLSLKDSGDFNGDGLLDLAFVNGEETTVKIWLNNSSGGNISLREGAELFLGTQVKDLAVADFNGDGISDFAAGKRTANDEMGVGEVVIVQSNLVVEPMRGTSGNDRLDGTENSDRILSSEGDDTIIGHSGDDRIFAGLGNDLLFGSRDRDILAGETGDDTLYGGKQDDVLSGDANEDTIGGNDLLFGNRNNDGLYGGAGDDTLYGGKDDDLLVGQNGDDWLVGDLGNDTLIGEAGRDLFVLGLNTGVDEIVDFTSGEDAIGLSGGLTFEEVTVGATNGLTTISAGDRLLATLLEVDSTQLSRADFVVLGDN